MFDSRQEVFNTYALLWTNGWKCHTTSTKVPSRRYRDALSDLSENMAKSVQLLVTVPKVHFNLGGKEHNSVSTVRRAASCIRFHRIIERQLDVRGVLEPRQAIKTFGIR